MFVNLNHLDFSYLKCLSAKLNNLRDIDELIIHFIVSINKMLLITAVPLAIEIKLHKYEFES